MLTFSAAATTGEGTVTPDLTWSTSPVAPGATPCVASSSRPTSFPNWNGPKSSSGRVTLAPMAFDATFTIRCTWGAVGSIATFTWVNPTRNRSGTPYTNPNIVRIKYTFNPTLTNVPTVAAPGEFHADVPQSPTARTTHTVTNILQSGPMQAHFFAQNTLNEFSGPSNVATKVFTSGVSVTQSVDVTVRPAVPNPPTDGAIE